MKRIVLIVCLLLTFAQMRFGVAQAAVDRAETMRQANDAYRQGRFDAAAEGYRALVADGVDDATVWYNLGNAYAQGDDVGRARACYERALRLSPRDPDLRANASSLHDRAVDHEPDEDLLTASAHAFTRNELAVVASAAWFACCGSLALWLRRRSEGLAWSGAASALLLVVAGGLLLVRVTEPARAVVVPGEVKLLNGPGREYSVGVSLHAGTRVEVLASEGDWREVGAFHRVKGWVRAEQIETI